LDYELLLTFKTVAQFQNFSKAADHLNLTQPAVTARIQKLETELDCKLFVRDGKKIILTREGEVLLSFSEKILSYMNEAKRTIDLLKVPKLKIGLSPAFSVSIVLQVMKALQQTHELSFDIVEGIDSFEIYDKVANDAVDIGLVRDIINLKNLESYFLCHDQIRFIVGFDHPLANKEEIHKEDLIGHTMICYQRHTPLWLKIDEKLVGIDHLNRIEVGSFEMVKSMVSNNWGFSFIPKFGIGHEDTRYKIRVISFPEIENIPFNVVGIYKKDSPKLRNLKIFLEFFKSTLNNVP
jgi:DNA-binding transcriptional LysR family regulator